MTPEGRIKAAILRYLERRGLAVVARSFRELDAALRREGYADDGPLFTREQSAPHGGA